MMTRHARTRPGLAMLAALLLAAGPSAAADGPSKPLRDYIVRPNVDLVRVQTESSAGLVGRTFASALTRSRDAARADSQPIPAEVRKALAPFYAAELMDKVRYSVGDYTPDGLAGFAIRHGQAAAVTLIDTVVFKDERYVSNVGLWAHELHHAEQYEEWGVEGFASRYAFGWRAVEQAAYDRAGEILQLMKHPVR